jgi:hypothetical protein
MSKSRKTNGFLMLEHHLLHSQRWHSLSLGARCLVLDMASYHKGKNNGAIAYSQRQCMRVFGASPKTAVKWFRELQEHQIIEAVHRGSFSQKTGQARGTTWRITFLKNNGE